MSKEKEARVRDDLLQSLYAGVLRCRLEAASAGAKQEGSAVAAGVCANLRAEDMLLTAARPGGSFRVLRGVSRGTSPGSMTRDRQARVYQLPQDEAQGVAFALGLALAAAESGNEAVGVVVLPAAAALEEPTGRLRAGELPRNWAGAGEYAARLALPLLLVSMRTGRRAGSGDAADPRRPAPLYPSIPVDVEDALAVYRVAFECTARARAGGGPSCLKAVGVAAGDAGTQGALSRLETMLRKRGRYSKAWQRGVERRIVDELSGRR